MKNHILNFIFPSENSSYITFFKFHLKKHYESKIHSKFIKKMEEQIHGL